MTALYRDRASAYRLTLAGDARYEADLDLEAHKRLQAALNSLGFANQGEGIFGASTRQAIASFQRSIGQAPAAFLTRAQAARLFGGTPDAVGGRSGRAKSRPIQNPQEAAAQALIMGIFGGVARNRGIPMPTPYPGQQGTEPSTRGYKPPRVGGRAYAEAPPTPANDDRFGDQGSVAFAPPAIRATGALEDGALRVVVVTGTGGNVEEAKTDASRQAVQQVAGLYVDARRRVETRDGDAHATAVVEEKIVSYTNAYVKKVEVLDTEQDGSSVKVRERVAVAVAPLVKVLHDNAVPTVSFDADSAAGTADTISREKQAAMDIYADLLKRSISLVKVSVGKAEVDASLPSLPDKSWLSIPITFKVNPEASREWRTKFAMIAKERASIEVSVNQAKIGSRSGRDGCTIPIPDTFRLTMGRTRAFLGANLPTTEHGVAACFMSPESDGPLEAECFGRRFTVDQRSSFDPCRGAGPCLFLRESTKKVRLVLDMLNNAGEVVFTTTMGLGNFPALDVRSSSDEPVSGRSSFLNYCGPRQTVFFGEMTRGIGAGTYGDVLLFPADDGQVRAYFNQLVPNEKISQIASIGAKLSQGE